MDEKNTPYKASIEATESAIPSAEAAQQGREPTQEEMAAMQGYAKRWRKRYPKKNAAQMAKAIMKKFGVQLT